MTIEHVPYRWAPTSAEMNAWIDALNAGVTGPTGPKGDPGEAGASVLSAFWTFNATTTAPPATGQMRSNSGNTTVWIHKTDADGFSRTAGLATIVVGSKLLVRAANGTAMDLNVTAVTDSGTYLTLTTTVASGTITKGARTQVNIVAVDPHTSAWNSLTLLNSFTGNAKWKVVGNVGYVFGSLSNSTASTGPAFTLPAAARPLVFVQITIAGGPSVTPHTLSIDQTTGNVTVNSALSAHSYGFSVTYEVA